jgi:hypothetical protein
MGHPRSVVASADSGFLSGLSARFGMTKVFVGFAARLKSCSRGASKIIRETGLWNPMSRKRRETWAPSVGGGIGLQRVPQRASSPVRNDKGFC